MSSKDPVQRAADSFAMTVAMAVETQRGREGMSLETLALKTGIGLRTIKTYLRSKDVAIPLPRLHRMAIALNTTVEQLIRDAEVERQALQRRSAIV